MWHKNIFPDIPLPKWAPPLTAPRCPTKKKSKSDTLWNVIPPCGVKHIGEKLFEEEKHILICFWYYFIVSLLTFSVFLPLDKPSFFWVPKTLLNLDICTSYGFGYQKSIITQVRHCCSFDWGFISPLKKKDPGLIVFGRLSCIMCHYHIWQLLYVKHHALWQVMQNTHILSLCAFSICYIMYYYN